MKELVKVGDKVKYWEVLCLGEPTIHTVLEVLPKGIPSFPKPMVKLSGKAGFVNEAHCIHFEE